MKTNIIFFFCAMISFFAPIQILVLILMFIIFVDTVVKLISLNKIAQETNRKYNEVFKSRILRLGYLYKTAGYFIMVAVIFPIDYYALTPFIAAMLKIFNLQALVITPALCTNILLAMLCLMEVSSINENWFDISKNNILKSVSNSFNRIRKTVKTVTSAYKETKDDVL
tara:strand:- start:467 stop:973 length:507 start_codon:yes stop_codon:yes gene_type:complete